MQHWCHGTGTWYLVVFHCCTKWLRQRKTGKSDTLLLHVAKLKFKRENGSISLQISKMEMRYFWNDKEVFLPQPTQLSWEVYWVGGGKGRGEAALSFSCPPASVLILLPSWAQLNLLWFPCVLNPWSQHGCSDFHRKTPYMGLLLLLFAPLPVQICTTQICPLASDALKHVHSCLKSNSEEEALSWIRVSFTFWHNTCTCMNTRKIIRENARLQKQVFLLPPYHRSLPVT